MGIYLFNWNVLNELLENTAHTDFGKGVIPFAIKQKNVYGYFFDGYWADVGSIKSFFETHMDLTETLPKFNFYDEKNPIFTHARFLPSSKILLSNVSYSILSEGSIINRSQIDHSIIGLRSRIGENSIIDHSIVIGADYFESPEEITSTTKKGIPNAIIDSNARIGNGVKLINTRNVVEEIAENYIIRDSITVIPANTILSSGTII